MQINTDKLFPALSQLIFGLEWGEKIGRDFQAKIVEIFSHLTMDAYQKKGYPLGKSIRGFKKWQRRQMC
ncbi:MAG: hypothetical protein M3367_03025 [Acidobacteriota bacterium]|nr:hypothetical protein [Acidobacteriota bacterium]